MNIFLVGNPLVDFDLMPLKVKPILEKEFPKIQFLEFDPAEDFPEEEPIFIDTVINLSEPKLFTSIDKFESLISKNYSVHNFDFYTELVLQKKLGRKYYIIGVPPKGNREKIAREISKLLKDIIQT